MIYLIQAIVSNIVNFLHIGLKDGSYEQYRYIKKKVTLLFLSTTFMLKEQVWDWKPHEKAEPERAFERPFHLSRFETLGLFVSML